MTIFIPDVSHYQTGLKLDGAPAVIAKGDQGSSMHDPAYADFHAQAVALGIPFVGYHWVTTDPLAAQAADAVSVMGDLPMMWDAEAAGADVPRLVELTTRTRKLGGNPRLVYLPHWWWSGHIGSPDLRPLVDLGLHLVSSDYPPNGYTENGPGWAPYGGMQPALWQYTDARTFNGHKTDANAFKGTVDDLRALLGIGGSNMTAPGTNADWSVGRGAPTQPGVTPPGNEAMTYWAGHVTDRLVALQATADKILAALTAGGGGTTPPAGLTADEVEAAVRAQLDNTRLTQLT